MDIEIGLISKLLEEGRINELIDQRISTNFFYGKGKPLIEYILHHYKEYRKTPSLEVVQREFPEFEPANVDEPFEYFLDEIRKRHKHNTILKGLEKITFKLQQEEVDGAEEEIYKLASKIVTEIKIARDLNYTDDIEARINRYLEKKQFGGMDGIPIGIKPIDMITGGAKKGQLITIVAQPKTGKTWLEVAIMVVSALKWGARVLFITKEMEPEEIALRMDSAFLGFEHLKLLRGTLGDRKEQEYFQALRSLISSYQDQLIISGDDGEGNVTSIQAKIEEHNPDIVVIDGSYLIQDELGGRTHYERATNITRALKRLARKCEIPIFNSTQAGRQVSRKSAPTMEDVSFTYAYAQDSDLLLSLYRTPEMKVAKKLGVKVIGIREGEGDGHYVLNWDFEDMETFGQLAEDVTSSADDIDEEVVIY